MAQFVIPKMENKPIENDINKDSIDIMLCEDNNHYNNNNNNK